MLTTVTVVLPVVGTFPRELGDLGFTTSKVIASVNESSKKIAGDEAATVLRNLEAVGGLQESWLLDNHTVDAEEVPPTRSLCEVGPTVRPREEPRTVTLTPIVAGRLVRRAEESEAKLVEKREILVFLSAPPTDSTAERTRLATGARRQRRVESLVQSEA